MIDALAILGWIVGTMLVTTLTVVIAFYILNLGNREEKKEERKPDAWRVKHGKRYYYMDKSEPFPTQDAEPLYLGKKEA